VSKRILVWVVSLAVLGGCGRCGKNEVSQSADAGRPGAAVGPPGALPATDLRSAIFLIFPEYRFVHVKGGRATLVREVTWSGKMPLAEALAPELTRLGYSTPETVEGALKAKRDPLEMSARPVDGKVVFETALPLSEDSMGRIIQSPSPMGTEFLSQVTPRLSGETEAHESFRMTLNYVAKPDRTNFLIRQLVELLTSVGWKPTRPLIGWEPPLPDGGVGLIPTDLELTLINADTGGRLDIRRKAGEVWLDYHQALAR
jgi:hypothetical protein